MVGKNNRPPVEVRIDDEEGWINIIFRTGCSGTSAYVPDEPKMIRKTIEILKERLEYYDN